MEFSNKTLDRTRSPRFFNFSKKALAHTCDVKLTKLDANITIFFNTVKKEELEVEMLNYFTEYSGQYLGVIDAFIQLIQNRPVEAIDRFPIKELDYFLRDTTDKSSFSGYSQELYEIIGIGESIKAKIYGDKKIGFQYDPEVDGEFYTLSYSEQIELLEEFFSYFVYEKGVLQEIEVIDIDEDIFLSSQIPEDIENLLREKLFLSSKISILKG